MSALLQPDTRIHLPPGFTAPHTNNHLYLYTLDQQGRATFERSMPRHCVADAVCRVLELKKQKREAFYIPGMVLPWGFA